MVDDRKAGRSPEDAGLESEGGTRTHVSPSRANLPRTIGHFTIKERIASGGMGTVYKAVQEQPRRSVAIKVMTPGVTSRSALRRFEYEAQLLARLRHPCIAQVYEAGTHDDGSGPVPFFAMEYIPNAKPITKYAEDKKLGTRERLELFARVCDAVHHGHQRGIIHRDLKPSNILVDSHGQPRVIDFGVARATDSDMAMTTLQTGLGQLIGTLQYMSPEQCDADPEDIDTRSDVYALGVVLYDLLCGRLPYDVSSVPPLEATRLIREGPTTRPSARVPALRGDVETITLKALERDRSRRYQSAHGLAQDIRRYLNGEAVAARPPSLAYQVRVFARRNRVALAATAAVFVAVLAGAVVSTALYVQARSARSKAEQEKQTALAAMSFLHDMVDSVEPRRLGLDVSVVELLDSYSDIIEEAFPDQPEVEAAVRTAMSRAYSQLDLIEKRDAETDHRDVAEHHLAVALDICTRTHGEDHPKTLEALAQMATLLRQHGKLVEAEDLHRRVLEGCTRALGEDHPDTLESLSDMASLLWDRGRFDEAEQAARRALDGRQRVLGADAPDTMWSMVQVAQFLRERGKPKEAEALNRQAVEVARRIHASGDWRLLYVEGELAASLLAQRKFTEVEALYGDAQLPDDLGIERWFQGETDVGTAGTTLFAMWEPWCPISFREIPRVESVYHDYADRGLQVVGLTRMTRQASEDKVWEFIRGKGLTFPMAKENGAASAFLNPRGGSPAAALVRNGKLVWRGRPAALCDSMLEGLVAGRAP